jgi:hypothetical protein
VREKEKEKRENVKPKFRVLSCFFRAFSRSLIKMYFYAEAVLKFPKLNTAAQQREAVAQGRSLPPIPASV